MSPIVRPFAPFNWTLKYSVSSHVWSPIDVDGNRFLRFAGRERELPFAAVKSGLVAESLAVVQFTEADAWAPRSDSG